MRFQLLEEAQQVERVHRAMVASRQRSSNGFCRKPCGPVKSFVAVVGLALQGEPTGGSTTGGETAEPTGGSTGDVTTGTTAQDTTGQPAATGDETTGSRRVGLPPRGVLIRRAHACAAGF